MSERGESPLYVFGVIVSVSLVCSLFVASSTILLRTKQETNRSLEKKRHVLVAAGKYRKGMNESEMAREFESIESVVLDFKLKVISSDVDAATYDMVKAARDTDSSLPLAAEQDTASLGAISRYGIVYILWQHGKVQKIILPVSGLGLWSTLYGFLALEADGRTISGINFFQHGETPGLGGEIDNALWLAKWKGKIAFDARGRPAVEIVKGRVEISREDSMHKVDGISGATITLNGVTNLVNFWLSDIAYGKFIGVLMQRQRIK